MVGFDGDPTGQTHRRTVIAEPRESSAAMNVTVFFDVVRCLTLGCCGQSRTVAPVLPGQQRSPIPSGILFDFSRGLHDLGHWEPIGIPVGSQAAGWLQFHGA